MRRLCLVVNPSAGGGRAARVLDRVEHELRGAGHDLVVTPTRSLAHADELAVQAVADDRVVVALGGDGLVGRLAGALASSGPASSGPASSGPASSGPASSGGLLAALPGGRGNDFCRAVGIPSELGAACRVLSTGCERRLDLGVVQSADGEAAFLGIASIGFDSAVQERVLTTRLPLGSLVYAYGALATVAGWSPASFRCTVDGEPLEVRGWAVAVSNSGRYGGGMRLAPDASLTDGLLDVVTTSATSRLRFLRVLPAVFRGTHVRQDCVTVRTARTVRLDADRPFRVFADGDPVGSLPATVSVRPGAVRVLLP